MSTNTIDYAKKIVLDYDKLAKLCKAYQELEHKIICTIGSWDQLHVGHVRYLLKAREHGDILVVGADSDRAIKLYKGPYRPLNPQIERLEMLSYQECVNFATVVDDVTDEGKWQYGLLDCIRPNVFIAVIDSYPEDQLNQIRERCGKVVVLSRQAETSSSSLFHKAMKDFLAPMAEFMKKSGLV